MKNICKEVTQENKGSPRTKAQNAQAKFLHKKTNKFLIIASNFVREQLKTHRIPMPTPLRVVKKQHPIRFKRQSEGQKSVAVAATNQLLIKIQIFLRSSSTSLSWNAETRYLTPKYHWHIS